MRKKIGFSVVGLLLVAIVLAALLGVIDTLAGAPPLTVSKPSAPDIKPGGSGLLEKVDLIKDISPEISNLPHTPLFDIAGVIPGSLLRNTATLNYDGELWNFQTSSAVQEYNGGKITPPVKDYSRKSTENVEVTSLADFGKDLSVLPTSLYPVSVDSPIPLQYLPDDQLFTSASGIPESYSFQAVQYQFDKDVLNKAEVAQDEKYLQLPPDITDRIHELAQDITQGIESPYQQAQAIQDYLKSNYDYNYDYTPTPADQEPNDWFLFQEKEGVCTQFNSAFVTLARCAGLPSRLVGGYAVNPAAKTQTVYADQAHAWSEVEFQGIGWQTFDATGDAPELAPTVTDITSVSNIVTKGNSFLVKGTVTSQGTTVEGVLVELFINPRKSQVGGILIGKGTVSGGNFEIEASIPDSENVGNYQLLAHSLKSTRYLESWSDPAIKVTADTQINLDLPARVRLFDSLQLKGTLTEKTLNPVEGQEVNISLNNSRIASVTTDQRGNFSWEQIMTVPGTYTLRTVFSKTEFYAGASQQSTVDVLLPVNVSLQMPPKARVGEEINISGVLLEEFQGKPVQGQKIGFFINNQPFDKAVSTGPQGNFSFQYSFDKPGIYRVEAVSDYTAKYWESRHTSAIEIIPLEFQFPWFYLVLALAVIASGIGIYILYTRTRSGEQATTGTAQAVAAPSIVPVVPEDNTRRAALKIHFPSIVSPFPDVWGVNDELETEFKLFDPAGSLVSGGDLKVYIQGRQITLTTGEDGTSRILFTFPAKGRVSIKAVYAGTGDIGGVTTIKEVKIVDYREEIIELFKYLIDWFIERGLSFPLEATPREIQDIVTASKLGLSMNVLARLVEYFEEADYSQHPVNRENYLRMYLVQREIRAYDR